MKNKIKILESIENEIMETNKELKYNRELQLKYPEKEGLKVNQSTLEQVHKHLLKKRENAIKNLELETVEISLKTENKLIGARILGRYLDSFQEVVIGIVRSLIDGKDAIGRAPDKIIDEATYEVTTFTPGSFKVSLLSKASHSEQATFGHTVARDAIDQLYLLLACEDNIEQIRGRQEKLGPLAIQKYKNFMRTVYKNKATFTISSFKESETVVSDEITTELAKKIHDVIEKSTEESIESLTFYGELVAVDIDKYEFGFIIHDGDKEDRINGEFNKNMKPLVKSKLEKMCTAIFDRNEVYNEISEDYKYKWELVGFEAKK